MHAHKIAAHPDYQSNGTLPDNELIRALELQPESFDPDALRALAERIASLTIEREEYTRALDWLDELGLLEAFERDESLPGWMDLDDFLNSSYWDLWQGQHMSDMPIGDPERYNRVVEAAEHGADGSTHAERLQDMRDAVDDYARDFTVLPGNPESLRAEINSAERWHERAGTLDEQAG